MTVILALNPETHSQKGKDGVTGRARARACQEQPDKTSRDRKGAVLIVSHRSLTVAARCNPCCLPTPGPPLRPAEKRPCFAESAGGSGAERGSTPLAPERE